jgi:hypothetical protein
MTTKTVTIEELPEAKALAVKMRKELDDWREYYDSLEPGDHQDAVEGAIDDLSEQLGVVDDVVRDFVATSIDLRNMKRRRTIRMMD